MSVPIQGAFSKVIINVSFPRSGNNFLIRLLIHYFNKQLVFQYRHGDQLIAPETNYVKDHDFGLVKNDSGIPINSDNNYIIQYRHPLESLCSYYEFSRFYKEIKDSDDSDLNWKLFVERNLNYWKKFMDKWGSPSSNKILLEYDDLIKNTESNIYRLLKFITDSNIQSELKINDAIASAKDNFLRYNNSELKEHKRRRDITKFKYFNREEFLQIENHLYPNYLKKYKIKRLSI